LKKRDLKLLIPLGILAIGAGLFLASISKLETLNQTARQQKPASTSSVMSEKTSSPTADIIDNKRQSARVTRVIDGDTIELENGQKVRYIGINTPETVDPRKTVECFGEEASAKNKELVEGKTIKLEKDVSETDKYSRLLRYVYVDNIFVNDYLVRQGFAYASTFPPDVKYQDQFRGAEQEAKGNSRGLWGTCQSNQNQSLSSQISTNTDCNIKGNISSSGEKIYHMPGQRYYNQTAIDELKGEKWFCSEDEAVQAGWRKSKI